MLSESGKDLLFRQARTHNVWLPEEVTDDQIHGLYELMKWCPTSGNTCSGRILFLRTSEAKERLRPAVSPANVDKTMAAPVVAILSYDTRFYEKMPQLFPARPQLREVFGTPEMVALLAPQGGTLQVAYFILAARSIGLDCGPMNGFDRAKVDAEFFKPGTPLEFWKSTVLCNVGHGDPAKVFPRNPRLPFDEACALL